jgi:hypothetical protein
MKRLLTLLLLVFLASLPLFSADSGIEIRISGLDSQSDLGSLVENAVLAATKESFLPRLPDSVENKELLEIVAGPLQLGGPYDVTLSLEWKFRGKSLSLRAHGFGTDASSFQKNLQQTLYLQLRYDALTLLSPPEGLTLDYSYRSSYSSLLTSADEVREGDLFSVLDAGKRRTGLLVVDQISDEEPAVAGFLSLYGKTLLPGMQLEKRSGRTLTLSLPFSYHDDLITVALEGVYTQNIGLYPFLFTLKGSALYRSDSSLAMMALSGVSMRLPLSMLFGNGSRFFNSSSLLVSCRIGMGFSPTTLDVLFGSEAELLYTYSMNSTWGLQLGVSSKNWSSEEAEYDAGLSLILATAYTW